MFGQYFKHVLILTLLSGITYSLPQVQDAMAGAFSIGHNNSVAAAVTFSNTQVAVKNITAKVAYDSDRKESAINVTAKVHVTATDSDLSISENGFSFTLRNKTSNKDGGYARSSKVVSNLNKSSDGFFVVKKGNTALFSVTAQANPKSMIAGQYNAILIVVETADSKLPVPTKKSNAIVVVGEASPYITVLGSGLYGTQDTLILNTVRLGKNPTITFKTVYDICEVGQVCPPSAPQSFSLRANNNSKQVKFDLSGKNLKPAQYQVYVTNTELGETSGKSNIITIQILNQSNILTAKVIAGKLALTYDAQNQEASLSALFNVKVKAEDTDLIIDNNSFNVNANADGYGVYVASMIKSVDGQTITLPYVLKAGKQAQFLVSASVSTKQMFAGSYTMTLNGIYPVKTSTGQSQYVQVNENQTNSVVIIGETSPYITSVSPSPATVGQLLTISGSRLAGSRVFIDGIELVCSTNTTCIRYRVDGLEIEINPFPTIADGFHMLSVKNDNTGASNVAWFESIGGVIISAPVLNSISQATTTSGSLIKLYGSGFLSKYSLVNFSGPATNLDSSPNSLTDNQIDIIVPYNIPEGIYNVSVVNLDSKGGRLPSQIIQLMISNSNPAPSITNVHVSDLVTKSDVINLQKGTEYGIRWSENNVSNPINVSLFKLEGIVWVKALDLNTVSPSPSGNGIGSMTWIVPSSLVTDNSKYKIYIETFGAGAQYIVSFVPPIIEI